MNAKNRKQRLCALILALLLGFDGFAQGLVCVVRAEETPAETLAVNPTEDNPVETDPTETTPVGGGVPDAPETEPAEADPAETAPTETSPVEGGVPDAPETEPAEADPVETDPTETTPVGGGVPAAPETEPVETEPPETQPELTLYEQLLLSESLQAFHDTMMGDPQSVYAMTAQELKALRAHADILYTALETPTQDDADYYVLITETVDYLIGELELENQMILPEGMPADAIELTEALAKTELGSGYYYLNSDLKLTEKAFTDTISSYIYIKKGVTITIDLNGYALIGNKEACIIRNNGHLTIKDSNPDSEPHYFLKKENAPWELVEKDTEDAVPISGGIITGGFFPRSKNYGGGGIAMGAMSTSMALQMDGGTIIGNYSGRAGAGTYGGAMTMNNGTIIGNYSELMGGGVSVSGSFTMNGGYIGQNSTNPESEHNQGEESDNNFYDFPEITLGANSSFLMTGGKIEGNISTVKGNTTPRPNTTITGGTVNGNFRILNSNKAILSGGEFNGRIYMMNGDCTIKENALIQNGSTENNGGAVYLAKGNFTMEGGIIQNAEASGNGGAVYVANGNFTMSGGTITGNQAGGNGGGVYMAGGTINMTGGKFTGNRATGNGGGAYLDGGKFTLNGDTAEFSNNVAVNGAGVYLTGGTPNLYKGTMSGNIASQYGGGIYIDQQDVVLQPTGTVTISGNKAVDGGGMYIGGDAGTKAGFSLSDETDEAGKVELVGNEASGNGGGVCLSYGEMTITNNSIALYGNKAENGGGAAVLTGTFTLSGGSIGESGKANTATNGGGVYVNGGEARVSGGSIQYNTAVNGGGAYVGDGSFTMTGGSIQNNTASGSGGGTTVSGGSFRMDDGEIKYNQAENGGGVCVENGTVEIVYGAIEQNTATNDGGGMLVSSSSEQEVKVVMLSGSLSHNTATGNGGGMAVSATENSGDITAKIGCLLDHKANPDPQYPIDYTGDYADYEPHKHEMCPQVADNRCGNIGGGFYLNSAKSTLNFYCIVESGNQAADGKESCWGMDVEGGTVSIGDEVYHNCEINGNNGTNRGYVSMSSEILVNGGIVNVYGDMTNPEFAKNITVDIQKQGDSFTDHRRAESALDPHYKVHYVENFPGPNNTFTGKYIAQQYTHEEAKTVAIADALFPHEGYTIMGWNTRQDGGGHEYKVGQVYNLTDKEQSPDIGITDCDCSTCAGGEGNKDAYLLKLYAIWQLNGYKIEFRPGVENYTGTMEAMTVSYGSEVPLPKNAYGYAGHVFKEWKREGTEETFADGARVTNLSTKNGDIVTLVARWEVCTHEDTDLWTYTAEGNILTGTCACGYTESITLTAEDAVYDKNEHGATAACSTTDSKCPAWKDSLPVISYAFARHVEGNEGEDPEMSENGIPVNTAVYTASITTGEATAKVEYTISKAPQEAPPKPTFDTQTAEGSTTITALVVSKIEELGESGNAAQYRLSYDVDGKPDAMDWQSLGEDNENCTLKMETAWTNYHVEAYYPGNANYLDSDVSQADSVFFFTGNVQVRIVCNENIKYVFDASGKELDKAVLTLNYDKDKYYLVGGAYSVTLDIENKTSVTIPEGEKYPKTLESDTDNANRYTMPGVPDNSHVVITIGETRKKIETTARVQSKQIFGTVNNNASVAISNDSAFTAYFQVDGYDSVVYGVPTLSFNQNLPAKTTIILLDKSNGNYWYYKLSGNDDSVAVTDFDAMGGTGKYPAPKCTEEEIYLNLKYQFIVDFSQCETYSTDDLTVTLFADQKITGDYIPKLSKTVTVYRKKTTFTLSSDESPASLSRTIGCTYDRGAAASRWDHRASALRLTPEDGTELPEDARIKAVVGDATVYCYPDTAGIFLIALPELANGTQEVTLTLEYSLATDTEEEYVFDADWLVSRSMAGKAPVNGDTVANTTVTFTGTADTAPAVKLIGNQRILKYGDTLMLTVQYVNTDNRNSVRLQKKNESTGQYENLGGEEKLPEETGQTAQNTVREPWISS